MTDKTIAITVRELDALVEDRDGCRFESRTLAADLHEMSKQNAELTGRLRDWVEKAQQFEDDALEATVERDEMRDERDELRTRVDELKHALDFETEQHTTRNADLMQQIEADSVVMGLQADEIEHHKQRIADLENQLAAARQQRDNHVATKPGLT